MYRKSFIFLLLCAVDYGTAQCDFTPRGECVGHESPELELDVYINSEKQNKIVNGVFFNIGDHFRCACVRTDTTASIKLVQESNGVKLFDVYKSTKTHFYRIELNMHLEAIDDGTQILCSNAENYKITIYLRLEGSKTHNELLPDSKDLEVFHCKRATLFITGDGKFHSSREHYFNDIVYWQLCTEYDDKFTNNVAGRYYQNNLLEYTRRIYAYKYGPSPVQFATTKHYNVSNIHTVSPTVRTTTAKPTTTALKAISSSSAEHSPDHRQSKTSKSRTNTKEKTRPTYNKARDPLKDTIKDITTPPKDTPKVIATTLKDTPKVTYNKPEDTPKATTNTPKDTPEVTYTKPEDTPKVTHTPEAPSDITDTESTEGQEEPKDPSKSTGVEDSNTTTISIVTVSVILLVLIISFLVFKLVKKTRNRVVTNENTPVYAELQIGGASRQFQKEEVPGYAEIIGVMTTKVKQPVYAEPKINKSPKNFGQEAAYAEIMH